MGAFPPPSPIAGMLLNAASIPRTPLLTLPRNQTPECGREFGNRAFANTIQGHIKMIGEHPENCHVDAETCIKLACALDGGISWCNDGATPITRPCGDIARDAMRALTRCKQRHKRQKKAWAHGQVRDSETSRVVVDKSSC